MTSRSLFFRLLKEDIKRRVWSIALLSLVFFLIQPVYCALMLDEFSHIKERKLIIENIIQFMGPTHFAVVMVTMASALLCGISGFYFLLSRKRVDFYHSIPVRRETIFAVNYINGFLIYFLPYFINVLFCLVILKINHYLDPEVINAAFAAILINTVYYGLIYTVVIIAVIMTGNFIVSILGSCVFLFYGPTFMLVKERYFSDFFKTYYTSTRFSENATLLTPLGTYARAIERWASGESISLTILISVTVMIVLIAVAIFLYHKRPSEAAGKAMAFSISRPVIKIALVLLLSLGGGVLFRSFVSSNYDGWFVFGLIFTLIIISAVIEIIYSFDIRSAFSHKKQLLICAVIIGEIACIFRFDCFGYDDYLPKENEIESMSVAVSGLDDNLDYVVFTDGERGYFSSYQYQLKYMKLTDYKSAYELAKLGVACLDQEIEMTRFNRTYTYYVKYKLKSGREVYRKYPMDMDSSYELMDVLYRNPEFKQAHFPINQWKEEKIGKVSVRYSSKILNDSLYGRDGVESYGLNLNPQEKNEFINIYKEELNALTLSEIGNSMPVVFLQFEINQYDLYHYYVYPSFKRTLAKLEEYGFDTSRKVKAEDIIDITVTDYHPDTDETTTGEEAASYKVLVKEAPHVTYTKLEDITEILPALISNDYYYNNNALIEGEEYVDVSVKVFNQDYNKEIVYGYMFKKDGIPDFIKKDLNLN